MKVIISETHDGRFIVQIPSQITTGGLYPLIPFGANCRNTKTCFDQIHEAWLSGWCPDDCTIEYRNQGDPRNEFTRG